jgi:predicted exporter
MKAGALAWLVIVSALCAVLAARLHRGIDLQTDMTALLPVEARDPITDRAEHRFAELLTGRILILIGDRDRSEARASGSILAEALAASGMASSVTYRFPSDAWRDIGKMYFPYRYGLLSEVDRKRLEQNRGQEIANRALASIYAPASPIDAELLRQDPFLLLPEFLSHLPNPLAALTPDDGILSIREGDITWVMLVAQLNGNAYAGAFQDRFISLFNTICRNIATKTPSVKILRLGAVFYAHAGGKSATLEATHLSIISTIGTTLLILCVFRALRPLWLMVLTITVGVVCAFAVCVSLFGGLHALVLLFGVGLNGIAIDYCWQYVTARFGPKAENPTDRLRRVLPGIALGGATTLIGYATLLLAPFPGLIQLAVFSAVGLIGSFVTIVLWLPYLDSSQPLTHGDHMLATAHLLWIFWGDARYMATRRCVLVLLGGLVMVGAAHLKINNDVRRQQTLDSTLHAQEVLIRHLVQMPMGAQFVFVQKPDREQVLRTEEALQTRLALATHDGVLGGFQSMAQFIPSISRQRQNRDLVANRLMGPFLDTYFKRLGVEGNVQTGNSVVTYLTPDLITRDSPIAFVRDLLVESEDGATTGLVLLSNVERPAEIQRIADSIPGVHFVDIAEEISGLLNKDYRCAMILIAVSVMLMLPVVIWRYGISGGIRVAIPPVIAVAATPPLIAVIGMDFTFFGAMGLVLVLSIGFDYAVFCQEVEKGQRPTTMLGILLALATTLLSFGVLAWSNTFAVRSFGVTLLVGTTLAFLMSPIASDRSSKLFSTKG